MPYRTPSAPQGPRRLPLLDRVAVKTACKASWDDMVGDAAKRFCCTCSKDVYDLTAMHPDEADAFLERHLASEGSLPCARIYQRRDGRVLTSECPAGETRRHLARVAKTLAAGMAGAAMLAATVEIATRPVLGPDEWPETTEQWFAPEPRSMMVETMGGLVDRDEPEERPYDVNAALRADEPSEPSAEGEGPARRRYVLPDPSYGVIQGTTALVIDTTEISASSPRLRRRL